MRRYPNQELIAAIQNGEENVLLYLTKKYFQSSRRWLRRHGASDNNTPSIFSVVLIKVWREIQQNGISQNVDFEPFFFNSLKEHFKLAKEITGETGKSILPDDKETIASCYSILEEESKKLLAERYVLKLSFEEIAFRHNFSNPVIAQFECNKAFSQLENISRARLNISSN